MENLRKYVVGGISTVLTGIMLLNPVMARAETKKEKSNLEKLAEQGVCGPVIIKTLNNGLTEQAFPLDKNAQKFLGKYKNSKVIFKYIHEGQYFEKKGIEIKEDKLLGKYFSLILPENYNGIPTLTAGDGSKEKPISSFYLKSGGAITYEDFERYQSALKENNLLKEFRVPHQEKLIKLQNDMIRCKNKIIKSHLEDIATNEEMLSKTKNELSDVTNKYPRKKREVGITLFTDGDEVEAQIGVGFPVSKSVFVKPYLNTKIGSDEKSDIQITSENSTLGPNYNTKITETIKTNTRAEKPIGLGVRLLNRFCKWGGIYSSVGVDLKEVYKKKSGTVKVEITDGNIEVAEDTAYNELPESRSREADFNWAIGTQINPFDWLSLYVEYKENKDDHTIRGGIEAKIKLK